MSYPKRRSDRSGQAMIFLVMIVIILAWVALWNFDLHKIIYVKSLSQNAGDAAALAAARWQGITLNLIGDLNIMQAVALTGGDTNAAGAIAALQARLCYVGPMVGFVAAEEAAKNNGVFNSSRFNARLREHADAVRTDYPQLFPEPYPNAWTEYSDMLYTIADEGLAVGPDNAELYTDYSGGHMLLSPDFYDAVAGRLWCWFFMYAPGLLQNYTGFEWWPPLPDRIPVPHPVNSEYFGLGLEPDRITESLAAVQAMADLKAERDLAGPAISSDVATIAATWYCYDKSRWTAWTAFSPTNSPPFPAAGTIKPQYDYAGADSAVRIQTDVPRITPGSGTSSIRWTAAAKPLGYLNDGQDRPDVYGLVLPAFHDVRLIPMDASSAPAAGAYDLDWRDHIEKHLPGYDANHQHYTGYMEAGIHGTAVDHSCWYCIQLITSEDPGFRLTGVTWLQSNSASCDVGTPPGGPGGGSRRGH